jgi:PAS domain S-box-containing protein
MGAFDCDLAAGTMLWDARMHELFGITSGSFSGKYVDFLALVHSEDRPKVVREITTALGERSEFVVEFRIVRPSDSAVRFLEMSFKVPSDTDGNHGPTIGVCQEVTEQRCTEDALVRERFILSTIMDNIPDRVYFKDRESRFTLVN